MTIEQLSVSHKAGPPSAEGRQIAIVRRDELPTLRSVLVDGQEHNLGIHKDFRKHPALAAILPAEARLSVAWVHLGPGEQLDVHQHPVATMIVVCDGRGTILGDLDDTFASGDVIAIPPGCRHGFVGGEGGYWALSVQFDGLGLYEDPGRARVHFEGERSPGLVELLRRNAEFARIHVRNPMFDLVREGHLADPVRRARFLDVVQVWSSTFHRLLLLRSATASHPTLVDLFEQHLAEELFHAEKLAADRNRGGLKLNGAGAEVWDPILDASSSWFFAKVLRSDDQERAVLVHLVLEVGSRVFHEVANPVLSPYGETDYFEVHEEADGGHEAMCIAPLDHLDARTYERLFRIQKQGWDMLETLCARMAALTLA